jgi:hypothetical protein
VRAVQPWQYEDYDDAKIALMAAVLAKLARVEHPQATGPRLWRGSEQ